MRDVLAAIGAVSLLVAAVFLAMAIFDPATVWTALEAVVPRPAPATVDAQVAPRTRSRDVVIWTNVELSDLVYRPTGATGGGETVTTADGQVVEEWVTLYHWTGNGPRDLGTVDIPADIWRMHYVADSSTDNPFDIGMEGPADYSFRDRIGGPLPKIVYRQGVGTYRVSVRAFTGAWDIAIQVPASAVR